MAIKFFETDLVGAGTQISTTSAVAISNGDTLLIGRGVNIISTGSVAISTGNTSGIRNLNLEISGFVAGASGAVNISNFSDTQQRAVNYDIVVSSTGRLLGDEQAGIFATGHTSAQAGSIRVTNAGEIASLDRYALQLWRVTEVFVVNDGSITSNSDFEGAVSIGADSTTIINTGLISSVAALLQPDSATINSADSFTSPGDTLTLINTGTIASANVVFSGVFTDDLIQNSGTMIGRLFMFEGDDVVVNSGFIEGLVSMGEGNDTYDGRRGTVTGEILGLEGDDTLFGGAGEEIIRGGADNDTIRGGGARDELYGEDGNDLILGQDGKDLLDGGAGEDELRGGDGEDSLIGGAGEDTLLGGFGDDRLDGGDDNDLLRGNKGEDLAFGGLGDDKIRGDDGNDDLFGNAGNDFLTGDRGDDLIEGGRGNDRIDGGVGIDTAVFAGDQANYTIQLLNNGDIRVTDNVGNDGVDRISTVEFFEFSDGVVAVADLFAI
ncbi:MAG: hypothetical protein AAGF20_03805 [Pseudomonadota bacterium]